MSNGIQGSEIMIIEDDDHIAQLLIFIFQREGFVTTHAANGQVAEKMIQENAPPALILLDVMLPYQDGFSLLKKIRTQPRWEEVPVIMLTAKSQENDIVRALNAGANDYVLKPFQPTELAARVRRFIKVTL